MMVGLLLPFWLSVVIVFSYVSHNISCMCVYMHLPHWFATLACNTFGVLSRENERCEAIR